MEESLGRVRLFSLDVDVLFFPMDAEHKSGGECAGFAVEVVDIDPPN